MIDDMQKRLDEAERAASDHEATGQRLAMQVDELKALVKSDEKELFEKRFALENARAKSESLEGEIERLRKMLVMLRKDNEQLSEKGAALGAHLELTLGELEALRSEHAELDARYQVLESQMGAIRQSVFTKLLIKAGIWRGLS